MTLVVRKLLLIGVVGSVFVVANALVLAHWLETSGAIGWASSIRRGFLTGTALTVILALLILLTPVRQLVGGRAGWLRRCRVCDHVLLRPGKYCPECGS